MVSRDGSRSGVKFNTYQADYKEVLDELANEYTGVAVADIRDMQLELQEQKKYLDITGNNINHPNDFFIRCYAHYLSGMLIK